MREKPIFGPYISFYDDTPYKETTEFQIIQEEDGLFFEMLVGGKQVNGVTLTVDTLKELKKVLKKEIKRLEK